MLGALGLAVILTLSPTVPGRGLLATGWSLLVLCQIQAFRSGFRRCRGLRFGQDGSIIMETVNGWRRVERLPGCLLLRGAGWIRLRLPGQPPWAEPIRGRCRESAGWRRLQVIWRHVGGGH